MPPNPQPRQPGPPPPAQESATTRLSTPSESKEAPAKTKRGFSRNWMSLALILVVVVLLVLAGLIGAELYTRHVADSKVTDAVQCEVQDSASVSFDPAPPVLWQYVTKHYTNISVQTAGNQVRKAKGMQVTFSLHDVKLNKTSDSNGTIGSINGTVNWSSDGIKESIRDAIPVLGGFVSRSVTTNTGDGTVELKGVLSSATVKPQIVNNGLSLQLVKLNALGDDISTESAQKHLDDLMEKATRHYPLGLHADTFKVTDNGVQATFSSNNATIPASSGNNQNPCFANL
ncbi:hypothetical protein AWC06_16445 [Mycobacterium fragae]|uniref:DUF2993 domain-containing protein n=1 Tax=Mycobacterium fragae TaxID=1260918 RepID=A0A1X1USP8_9MYCO|nr:hypothetical protein AWC06_16445 [Mycobacterium fragae]